MDNKPEVTAFFDELARQCRANGKIALAMSHMMKPYGGFGNLTIGEENEAYDDMEKQCIRRGLQIVSRGPYFIAKSER